MCFSCQPDPAVLERLEAALTHRGPGGSRRHLSGSVGLVSTRLAIIDCRREISRSRLACSLSGESSGG